MNILHLYKDYYPVLGGMENHIKMLAEAQVKEGHAVTVLVTHPTGKTHVEEVNGVRVIKAGRLATIASTPITISMPLLLRKEQPHVTHLHFPYPLGELSQFLFGRSPRTVLTYHSDVVRQKSILRMYHPFLKMILRKVDRIIATSHNYIESSPYLRAVRSKCTVIPLGIDLAPFLDPDASEVKALRDRYGCPLLLFVGKLRYYKGLQYLLEAMTDISAKLLVVGSGPMETYWRKLASSLKLGEKVVFCGEARDEDLPALYHAADIFVLPASERSEAFGLVQVEAMASGKPVVSTELGTGTSFVNLNHETGLVVPARDPLALRDAMARLLGDDDLRLAMGRAGRERALKEFSLETMVKRIGRLYEEVCNS
jgi:glycosyltransferase involved in cell wall biosynthesis